MKKVSGAIEWINNPCHLVILMNGTLFFRNNIVFGKFFTYGLNEDGFCVQIDNSRFSLTRVDMNVKKLSWR